MIYRTIYQKEYRRKGLIEGNLVGKGAAGFYRDGRPAMAFSKV
jgi:hypothetical protein